VGINHFFDIEHSCPVVAADANAGAAHAPLLLNMQYPLALALHKKSSN
jgi:hypothetical protein